MTAHTKCEPALSLADLPLFQFAAQVESAQAERRLQEDPHLFKELREAGWQLEGRTDIDRDGHRAQIWRCWAYVPGRTLETCWFTHKRFAIEEAKRISFLEELAPAPVLEVWYRHYTTLLGGCPRLLFDTQPRLRRLFADRPVPLSWSQAAYGST